MPDQPIVHRNLALLQVEDPHVFEEIRQVLHLEEFSLGMLSEREMIIDPRRMKELVERLDEKGLGPLVRRA